MALQNEHELQKQVVKYLETKDIMYTMIPNELGMFKRSPDYFKVMNSFLHLGFKPGLPDMLLIIKNKLVFLELKYKNGKLSEAQKKWHKALIQANIKVFVCYTFEEVVDKIENLF